MRVGVDATFAPKSGSVAHVREVLAAWRRTGVTSRHEVVLFTRDATLASLGDAVVGVDVVVARPGPTHVYSRLVWEQTTMPRLAARTGVSVLLCPGNFVPLASRVPTVVLFQNIGPFCRGAGTGVHDRAYFRVVGALMRLSARRAASVVFISERLQSAMTARVRIDAARVHVVPHGRTTLPAAVVPTDVDLETPFALAVGHLYPYKNYGELLEAVAIARDAFESTGLRLVLAGDPVHAAHHRLLQRMIGDLGLRDLVLLVGKRTAGEVAAMLDRCRFFVFQSTCEAMPLSLVEAVCAGAAVASADDGATREIGGDAAEYFDARDARSIARILDRLARDDGAVAAMRQRSKARAEQLPTWDEVATRLLDVLEHAGTSP